MFTARTKLAFTDSFLRPPGLLNADNAITE